MRFSLNEDPHFGFLAIFKILVARIFLLLGRSFISWYFWSKMWCYEGCISAVLGSQHGSFYDRWSVYLAIFGLTINSLIFSKILPAESMFEEECKWFRQMGDMKMFILKIVRSCSLTYFQNISIPQQMEWSLTKNQDDIPVGRFGSLGPYQDGSGKCLTTLLTGRAGKDFPLGKLAHSSIIYWSLKDHILLITSALLDRFILRIGCGGAEWATSYSPNSYQFWRILGYIELSEMCSMVFPIVSITYSVF